MVFMKNRYIWGNFLKWGGGGWLGQFADLGGGSARKRGMVVLRGVIPQYKL